MADPDLAAEVHHSGGTYPVVAGWGIIDGIGQRFEEMGIRGPAYIITDENVMNPYGRNVQRAMQKAGIAAHCFIIPSGESSKSFELAQAIFHWLVERRAERGQTIIAVGGGVVGDLAGFVAAGKTAQAEPGDRIVVVGDAAERAVAALCDAGLNAVPSAALSAPDARTVAALAAARWSAGTPAQALRPLYLRPPDATVPRNGGRLRP